MEFRLRSLRQGLRQGSGSSNLFLVKSMLQADGTFMILAAILVFLELQTATANAHGRQIGLGSQVLVLPGAAPLQGLDSRIICFRL